MPCPSKVPISPRGPNQMQGAEENQATADVISPLDLPEMPLRTRVGRKDASRQDSALLHLQIQEEESALSHYDWSRHCGALGQAVPRGAGNLCQGSWRQSASASDPASSKCTSREAAGDGPSTWAPAAHMTDPTLQVSACTSPSYCKHLGSRLLDGRFSFACSLFTYYTSLSVCHSACQINKEIFEEKTSV